MLTCTTAKRGAPCAPGAVLPVPPSAATLLPVASPYYLTTYCLPLLPAAYFVPLGGRPVQRRLAQPRPSVIDEAGFLHEQRAQLGLVTCLGLGLELGSGLGSGLGLGLGLGLG